MDILSTCDRKLYLVYDGSSLVFVIVCNCVNYKISTWAASLHSVPRDHGYPEKLREDLRAGG